MIQFSLTDRYLNPNPSISSDELSSIRPTNVFGLHTCYPSDKYSSCKQRFLQISVLDFLLPVQQHGNRVPLAGEPVLRKHKTLMWFSIHFQVYKNVGVVDSPRSPQRKKTTMQRNTR